jgi:hyperosmotically inducible protein
MKLAYVTLITVIAVSTLVGCADRPAKSPDVAESVRISLAQAGLKDVTVTQDRDKGVVTLGGQVASEDDKARAESIAKPIAVGQVLAVEIAVVPVGAEKDAKSINTDLDKGIEHNLGAALTASRLQDAVKFDVNNAVVTLKGEVDTQAKREMAEQVAIGVPYVKQVVNTLQVKGQKATSRK